MQTDLSERTALVTGAGRGNGRAIALELADNGASVVVNDLESERAASTVEEITEAGGEATSIPADVSDESEVEAMVAESTEALGTIDVQIGRAHV